MKYYPVILAAALVFSCAQAANAQTVLERFPIDRSTCTGGLGVSAYFDHDSSSAYKDYQCGTKSYNGHKGTDFAPWGDTKYSCSVVAAAPGKVLSTKDGLVDNRSSAGSSNPDCSNGNSYGNHVKIQQNDGSVVVYAHMKKGSIKVSAGQTVTCGQAIGVAQSSGCSTGTHLHFDIAPSNGGTRFDPYKGSCGSSSTRWVSQGDYKSLPAETCQCTPNCSGKTCGDDGCGGSCGSCNSNESCTNNKCVCTPNCSGKLCGDDGCGGSCGECLAGEECQNNACVCVPNCSGKLCGDDGCGGSCGECLTGEKCQDNACICAPNCDGKSCGDDGCGGSCGECLAGEKCQDNACVCAPNCDGKSCGDDGCGGSCGECKSNETCTENACVCVPNCDDKSCGDDGCGGSCGECSECSDDESPVCDGNRIKSCKNGEYVYENCGEGQSCKKASCVDDDIPTEPDDNIDAHVNVNGNDCSATPLNSSGSLSLALLTLLSGLLLRRRKFSK